MSMKLSRNTFLAILLLVLVATGYNIAFNPEVEAEVPDLVDYGGAGFNFQLHPGIRFNYSKLGDFKLTYNEGLFFRVLYENETHLPWISITRSYRTPLNLQSAVERAYNYSDPEDVTYLFGGFINRTLFEHPFYYSNFTKETINVSRTGYVGYWNCTNSARTLTVMIESGVDSQETLFLLFNQTVNSATDHYPGQMPPSDEKDIKLPIKVNTIINVNLMIMMTVGFTFTFMMEGFLNFAHTSYAAIGGMTSFYLTRFLNFQPYDTWPFAALAGGTIGVLLYVVIVKRIRQHGGNQEITLTFTFLVIAQLIPSLALVFNWWARYYGGSAARGYNLRYYDFWYRGIPGIALVSTAACILLIIGLRYFLSESKIGLSLRAVAENEELASTIGINTHLAHCASWFISGALSALVGSIITMNRGLGLGGADDLIVSVMSGAVLGGLYSVYGAIIGGLFVAVGADLINKVSFAVGGFAMDKWRDLTPLLFLIIALFFFPDGLMGTEGVDWNELRGWYRRLREQYLKRG